MQLPRHFLGLICLAAASGCSQAPEAVFVDLSQVSGELALPSPEAPKVENGKGIAAQHVTLPKSAGTVLYDRAEGKIAEARKLIDQDRQAAKRTLSRRLAAIKNKEIDDAKRKALEDLLAKQSKYLDTIYNQLFAIFRGYAEKRGPKTVRIELLLSKRSIFAPGRLKTADIAAKQAAELAGVRKAIQDLDEEYDNEATRLITDAEFQLSVDQGELHAQFETMRANAIEQADKDAQHAIDKATGNLDLKLGQNRSMAVNSVDSRTVTVPASTTNQRPIEFGERPNNVAAGVGRHEIDQQLEIWLKTRGYTLAKNRSDGRDATDEFNAWRKTHRFGL